MKLREFCTAFRCQMRTRGEGVKNPKTLRTSYMDGPLERLDRRENGRFHHHLSLSLIIVTSQKWPSGVSRCEVKEGRKELRSEKEGCHDSATNSIRRPLSRELFQGCLPMHNAGPNERPIRPLPTCSSRLLCAFEVERSMSCPSLCSKLSHAVSAP